MEKTPPRRSMAMKRSEMPRTARCLWISLNCGPSAGKPNMEGKGTTAMDRLATSVCVVIIYWRTHRRATKIGTVPRVPKNCTPALPTVVPRLSEGCIPDTHRHPPLDSAREIWEGSLLPYTRSEEMVKQNTRTRRARTIVASSAPQSTSVPPSTPAHHARERAVGP